MKGKLYCVCNKAQKDCDKVCAKGKRIKPDHIICCETWIR